VRLGRKSYLLPACFFTKSYVNRRYHANHENISPEVLLVKTKQMFIIRVYLQTDFVRICKPAHRQLNNFTRLCEKLHINVTGIIDCVWAKTSSPLRHHF